MRSAPGCSRPRRPCSVRLTMRAWPPPSSWSKVTRSPSSRSTPGCRSSTRSPNRSPGWTWSKSGCASPTAPASLTWPWLRPRAGWPCRSGSTPRPCGRTLEQAARRAVRALNEFDIAGVPANTALLRAVRQAPGLGSHDVGWIDAHVAELAADSAGEPPDGDTGEPSGDGGAVRAPLAGTVVAVAVAPGDPVAPDDELLVIEAMKMEHEVRAQAPGLVREVAAAVGATVAAGDVLVVLAASGAGAAEQAPASEVPLDHVRPDLAEVRERHRTGLDEGRPEVTARRHAAGRRTARENIADLTDPGSFTEYGALTIAAQRRRRPLDDLIARTPADGLILGTATVDGRPVAVMSYDYSVLAGTQGHMNHRKTDRLLELAERERLPLVMFAE